MLLRGEHMNTEQFKSLVFENEKLFKAVHQESDEQLSKFEQQLGFRLSSSMKWLLSSYGYSRACGITNLEDSVQKTIECRASINLPHNILLINDWGDDSLVFSITDDSSNSEYEIFWSNIDGIYGLIYGEPLHKDACRYENYPAWVVDRLGFEKR